MPTITSETINVGAVDVRFIVEADQSDGQLTVFECDVAAEGKVPIPHSHDAFDETIYGLDGVTTYTVDGEAIELGPGDSVFIARGVPHGFENHGPDNSKFLAVITPGLFGPEYFKDIGAVLAAAAGGPPDLAALADVMKRHGLTPVR